MPALVRTAAFLLVAALLPAQRQVWIVDTANGPGAHFTSLQAAAVAAAPGDVLLVRAGGYGVLDTDKGLTILGEGAGFSLSRLLVHDLPAGAGLAIDNFAVNSPYGFSAVEIHRCGARVVLRDGWVVSSLGGKGTGLAFAIADCADVVLQDVDVHAQEVLFATRCALQVVHCDFELSPHIHPSVLVGWPGGTALDVRLTVVDSAWTGVSGGYGAPALNLVDCMATIAASAVGATQLTSGTSLAAYARPAIRVVRGTLAWDGNRVAITSTGTTAPIENLGAIVVDVGIPIASGSASLGGAAVASLQVQQPSLALLAFGLPTPATAAGDHGQLRVRPDTCALVVGVGSLTTQKPVPNVAALLGVELVAQGAAFTAAGLVLSNAVPLLLR